MKKCILAASILVICTTLAASPDTTPSDAWFISSAWMRDFLIDTSADLPSAEFSRTKFIHACEDVGRSFGVSYGNVVVTDLIRYMSEHSKLTLSLIESYKKKDDASLKDLQDSWKLNATNLCTFLSKTNPYLRFASTRNLFFDYFKRMTSMIQARVNQQWQTDANEYELFLKQATLISRVIYQALIDAFPVRKKEAMLPKKNPGILREELVGKSAPSI